MSSLPKHCHNEFSADLPFSFGAEFPASCDFNMASNTTEVDLGFVEKVDNWRLLSHFFPSKVGGKPAWLSLNPVPSSEDLKCSKCGKPCVFLCQIYSPDSTHAFSFHRTLFVFICKEPKCCQRNKNHNLRVLRSQLGRKNRFYSDIPPEEEKFSWSKPFPTALHFQPLCGVCGVHAPKICAKCKQARYCSRDHQIVDWKNGHKEQCKKAAETKRGKLRYTMHKIWNRSLGW